MSRIEVGQRWRWISADSDFYTRGRSYAVLSEPDPSGQFAMEDNSNQNGAAPHYWTNTEHFYGRFELANGPVETVTVKRVVPGYYGSVEVTHGRNANTVGIRISSLHGPGGPEIYMNADDLRNASEVLSALADALAAS